MTVVGSNDTLDTQSRQILCLAMGGSYAYGLSTPTSDVDVRGVFVNTDVSHLVGLRKEEVLVTQNGTQDKVLTEFRHSLRLLRNANTQMIELLYTTNFIECHGWWRETIKHRTSLVSSDKLFNSLRGYMQGELRLANGERTGKLGGKRKEAIDKYGFSPKNFVQLLRLAWAGTTYFMVGGFPVDLMEHNPSLREELYKIKTQPEQYTREDLNERAQQAETILVHAYENRRVNTTFNEDIANDLCLKVYGELIARLNTSK